jgi:hypothetical protein
MPKLDMIGPFRFSQTIIDVEVPDERMGNYTLGYTEGEYFIVRYVGRSDTNLRTELKYYLNLGYTHFKFSVAQSRKAAFEKECRNYHDFGGDDGKLDNQNHPGRPDGLYLKCPVCSMSDQDDE